ncbi:MAG: C39 family peptidase [Deltaproteobacteria bacterium]|nr:C39 family peptidase [Deltaproteobacteria bacterium]
MNTEKFIRLSLIVFFLFAAIGCGINRNYIREEIKRSEAGYLREVPFFPQNTYMCGPAAMASVVGYWGEGKEMDEVAKEVYHEKLRGTLPIDLLIYAKEKGFDAKFYKGDLDDLKKKISSGTPVILFLNLGYEFYPVGHYIVPTGYNDDLRAFTAHSGVIKDEVFTYDELERAWGKTGYSTLLLKPKGR